MSFKQPQLSPYSFVFIAAATLNEILGSPLSADDAFIRVLVYWLRLATNANRKSSMFPPKMKPNKATPWQRAHAA